MFTFIRPFHLAILTHHHHNNIHNDDNNNTVSATHTQKSLFLLPTPTEVALNICKNFVSYCPSNIQNSKLTLFNNFL